MILDRLYNPSDSELIYHYCRPEAFLEIIKNRSVWLSAHYVMNDTVEREWGYSVFATVLDKLREEFGNEFADSVETSVHSSALLSVAMLSCYSLDADVLSQWRAYADDGRGFAIGFDPKLMKLPAKHLRVLYEEEAQIAELTGNLRHVFNYEKSIGFKFDEQFRSHWINVGLDLIAYKHAGFREEKEIRLVHVSGLVPHGSSFKLHALGARDVDGAELIGPRDIRFRSSNGVIVPYVSLDFTDEGKNSPVKEIVLGPRNESSEANVELFLNTVGIDSARIRRSTVPYR